MSDAGGPAAQIGLSPCTATTDLLSGISLWNSSTLPHCSASSFDFGVAGRWLKYTRICGRLLVFQASYALPNSCSVPEPASCVGVPKRFQKIPIRRSQSSIFRIGIDQALWALRMEPGIGVGFPSSQLQPEAPVPGHSVVQLLDNLDQSVPFRLHITGRGDNNSHQVDLRHVNPLLC